MRTSNHTRFFWLFGAAIIIMITATIVILLLREERGFMARECHEGQGDYALTKWARSDLPIPVYLSVGEERLEADVKKAIGFWAPYVQWGGYTKPLEEDPPDPVIIVDAKQLDPEDVHGDAVLKWVGACRVRRVEIKIPMPLIEGRIRQCVTKHEIGHALGLAHDDDEDSVMSGARDWRFRCEITEHDQALLAKEYSK